MDKRAFSERDICTKFITPALRQAGWDELLQIREEVGFTKGRIIVRGKLVTRGQAKRADYILYYKPNIPLALIEAKDNSHSVGDGMQQALDYAATLDIPFVFSSNGDGFVFHDRTGLSNPREANLALDAFPSPADLWARYRAWKGLDAEAEQVVLQDYYGDGSDKAPRYYQVNAVNAAIEAIAKSRNRVLLVMATGTGKTYTAFQIIWRLWKAGRAKRVLYLADRNVLIDQTMVNDFRPFGGTMAKLSTRSKTIERDDGASIEITTAMDSRRRIDTAYEIYLGLYQAITGPEERQKIYREFSREFFDLIVIDECHRGSAAEDSAWREILEYFSGATQIGMTATPKETKYISNIAYFGEPVYSYSLREGIRDGFLAPYKVVKVHIDRDVEGYRPEKGQLDREGEEVEDRIYNAKDFDRTLVLDDRTKLVARKITDFLKESGDRFQKTIVFCVDQEHAARMGDAAVVGAARAEFRVVAHLLRGAHDRRRACHCPADAGRNPRLHRCVLAAGSRGGVAVRALCRLGGVRLGAERLDLRTELTGGRMRRRIVTVNDKMQRGYRYELVAPAGRSFDPAFRPELTPKRMLELGVFCGKYLTDCRGEFPASWFARAKLSPAGRDCSLNYFGVDASQPLSEWQRKGWIHADDPRGWFQWYCRYYMGRRLPEEDARQIGRWNAMRRHVAQIRKHCEPGDPTCRARQRQALLHWAYDSRKI